MNDLEERLRAALDARAGTYTVSPDAYRKVRSRGRRVRRWQWLALLPVAAGVTAVAVFLTVSGGAEGDIATGTVEKGNLYRRVTATYPPVGEPVTVDDPAENRPVIMWITGKTNPADSTRYGLCAITQQASGGATSFCTNVPQAGRDSEQAWYLNGSDSTWPRRRLGLSYGAARDVVAKVEAIAKDGTRIPGTVHRPGGAPLVMWTVAFPSSAGVTRFEFSDSGGKVVQRLKRDEPMTDPDVAKPPIGPALDMAGGLTARLYANPDRTVVWSRGGDDIGLNLLEPGQLLADLAGKKRPVDLRLHEGLWYGVARTDTARISLVFKDGTSADAGTVPDPWGGAAALFSGTYRHPGDAYLEGFRLVGYDAAGVEIWHDDVPAVTPIRPDSSPEETLRPPVPGN
ncbi:hypothetical protein FHR32_000137 [Streptosporangium album]|uniref:Uncharacterized protein n=1 Tax=Streptosporangium album TaxID=47479 RepID=A0A7W7W620_9ACTN|nr:hypothetical protein [Streptosporangium album]MBB4935832.1 hypothetical protein [Streptosporangium album]